MEKKITISKSALERTINEAVRRALMEAWDGGEWYSLSHEAQEICMQIDNNYDCSDVKENLTRMVQKHVDKGDKMDVNFLANCSIMRRLCQMAVRAHKASGGEMQFSNSDKAAARLYNAKDILYNYCGYNEQ